jgi:methyl-accepting chemotaxis protein
MAENKPVQNKRKLRNYLINPGYQIRYILWLTTTGLLLLAMNGWIFYHYISENYALLVELSPMTDESKNQLFLELREILVRLAVVSSSFMFVVMVLGLIFSHKAAGPLFHFKRVFEEIKQGKLGARVRLRPGDEFQDVAQAFNEMMDTVDPSTRTAATRSTSTQTPE